MEEPRGQELVTRYTANYAIASDRMVTEEMILQHWELEKRLRKQLLDSSPTDRWQTFDRCYSQLFGELDWLNRLVHSDVTDLPSILYRNWIDIIGDPPARIYEIGSGKGELAHYLARRGFLVKATEITRERGQKWGSSHPNLSWGVSDGIHLDRFEAKASYDVVISNQVVEHLHPDDLPYHFLGVFSILCKGGRYILSTPHAAAGPSDISRVFKRDTPMGTHLKEYTYREIVISLRQAGFRRVHAVLRPPMRVRRMCQGHLKAKASGSYMAYLRMIERLIGALPRQRVRRQAARASKLILFAGNIMAVATKA